MVFFKRLSKFCSIFECIYFYTSVTISREYSWISQGCCKNYPRQYQRMQANKIISRNVFSLRSETEINISYQCNVDTVSFLDDFLSYTIIVISKGCMNTSHKKMEIVKYLQFIAIVQPIRSAVGINLNAIWLAWNTKISVPLRLKRTPCIKFNMKYLFQDNHHSLIMSLFLIHICNVI